MKIAVLSIAAIILLSGCNAVTATADKMMNNESNFSQIETTQYPIGEGPNYDAQTKADAALVEMQKTQAKNAQYPKGEVPNPSMQ
ncbi:hypothetical protein U0021_03400 [Moraxella canis]|uniref:Lipoprotein n=1 Tax=Moraxella canis TaxID=90239 RepID=A0ABZ0X029_9GAMM|nr:hypothetical protein [Moraxella canis]WQE04649.1 hypothetical protein U0021_03400 [Moraxella canis]